MPGQIDGNTLEILTFPETLGRVEAQAVEVLWGTAGTIPAQQATIHNQVLEVLAVPRNLGLVEAQALEVLWLDLSFEAQADAQAVEVLWGTAGAILAQQSSVYGQVVELLTTPPTAGDLLAGTLEFLVRYDAAVAAVGNISGPSVTPATFDGTTSLGFISQYRWSWVSVPVGSLLVNEAQPYPDFGGTAPFDMTSNVLLYHAEETVGITGADTSGSGNTANLTAITVGVPGKVGLRSWQFTGSTSKALPTVQVPIASSWTIAYWFLGLAPNSSWRTGIRGTANHHIIVETGGDTLGLYQGGFRPINTGFQMPPASYTGWHHMAAVGTAGGDTRFYIDGVFVGVVEGYRPTDDLVSIGNWQGNNQRFADQIDECAVWTRELSDDEISELFLLQEGSYTGIGPLFTFLPDEDGLYTVNLTVVGGLDGTLSSDTAIATIGKNASPYFFQGDRIRYWGHLQGGQWKK